jgi:hypothetical protein
MNGMTTAAPPPAGMLSSLLSLVLEGSSSNLATMQYYEGVARHVQAHDPELLAMVWTLVSRVRARYRSAKQHERHVACVPVTKQTDPHIVAVLEGDCAICLRPLASCGGNGVVRVRPASGDPTACGHFFHRDCLGRWELANVLCPKTCPLCREDLGLVVHVWEDHESRYPLF